MRIIKHIERRWVLLCLFIVIQLTPALAIDLQILSGFYDQAQYPGYQLTGTYKVELSKDNYTFTDAQFEINISLPQQGAYDPARAAEAIIPAGWELVVNTNTSLILRLLPGFTYAGTGAAVNRRRDFFIPIITSGATVDNPSLTTVQWNDFEVEEATTANSAGSVLNVSDVNLPVTLSSFNAVKEGNSASLFWATTEETNSDYFEVQRSGNGKSWLPIGTVFSHGESAVLRHYTFTDGTPITGQNYYRLKMVDNDNTFAYSRIENLDFGQGIAVLYPNPTSDQLTLREEDIPNITRVEIISQDGKVLYDQQRDERNTQNKIDVKNFRSGVYVVRLTRKDHTVASVKIVKD